MTTQFKLTQNDKGHWTITAYKKTETGIIRVNSYTCMDLDAVREVLEMWTGSQHIILEESA